MTTYAQLIKKLFDLQTTHRGKLDLVVMRQLCQALGNPQEKFKSVHIAGTNGKGSVSTLIASALEQHYGHVGLYTSPHVNTFRERIQINRQIISENAVLNILQKVFETAEKENISASFFEITTAAGFFYFADQNVDYAVIETGLGGRHDATNVITPVLSVITSISLEHTEVLGNTLEEIAFEKAGIIKPSVPVVIGPTVPLSVVVPIVKKLKSSISRIDEFFSDYRAENRALAAKSLNLLGIDSLLERTKLPPCRFEQHFYKGNIPVIFDVAHNPAGMEKLTELLEEHYPQQKFNIVIAISKTKDLKGCIEHLLPYVDCWFPVAAKNGRSFTAVELMEALVKQGVEKNKIQMTESIHQAMTQALQSSDLDKTGVLVCGTFFIMTEARQAFGIEEPFDEFDLNEKTIPKNI